EFERLRVNATPEETGVTAGVDRWRKLRGLGSLDRRRLAVVRELYNWREQMAVQLNRPARTVVRDDLLVEIARRNPVRERDLQVVRGLARRHLAAIVQSVQNARSLPIEECPPATERDQDPIQVGLIVGVMMAVLNDLCQRGSLATSLVATNHDV